MRAVRSVKPTRDPKKSIKHGRQNKAQSDVPHLGRPDRKELPGIPRRVARESPPKQRRALQASAWGAWALLGPNHPVATLSGRQTWSSTVAMWLVLFRNKKQITKTGNRRRKQQKTPSGLGRKRNENSALSHTLTQQQRSLRYHARWLVVMVFGLPAQ